MKVLAISNKIKMVNTHPQGTVLVTFGDDRDSMGNFYSLDPTFKQQVRLDIKLWKQKPLEGNKNYRNNLGVYQHNNVIIDRLIDIETDYFDAPAHIALAVASKHKYFYINGKRYFRNSEYDINWSDEAGDILQLAMAKATLIEQGKGFTNQAC